MSTDARPRWSSAISTPLAFAHASRSAAVVNVGTAASSSGTRHMHPILSCEPLVAPLLVFFVVPPDGGRSWVVGRMRRVGAGAPVGCDPFPSPPRQNSGQQGHLSSRATRLRGVGGRPSGSCTAAAAPQVGAVVCQLGCSCQGDEAVDAGGVAAAEVAAARRTTRTGSLSASTTFHRRAPGCCGTRRNGLGAGHPCCGRRRREAHPAAVAPPPPSPARLRREMASAAGVGGRPCQKTGASFGTAPRAGLALELEAVGAGLHVGGQVLGVVRPRSRER